MKKLSTEEFIYKAILKHGNKYDYSDVVYLKSSEKVKIKCFEHGIFEQTPSNHLDGQGCPLCTITTFNNGFTKDGFVKMANGKECTFYIIKCFNDQEEFYKIGITSKPIKVRFCSKRSMPYNYTILKEIKADAETIWNIENNLKEKLKSSYTPNIKFDGSLNECFSDYEEIENIKFEYKEV